MESLFYHIIHFFQASYDTMYIFTFIVAAFLLLSGLDDLALDFFYWFYQLFRPEKLQPYAKLPPERLDEVAEKNIALYIPAWQEHNVIAQMLTRACSTIQYSRYDVFVGVYPNDPATLACVESVSARFPQVHAVIGNHTGPSTKADNLNEIHAGLLRWENKTGIRYDIIMMTDAEDLINPLSLKVFNYFIPEYDMVQLPVFPLETPRSKFVHWTYCDEFAENHTKDLMARQMFSGFVPSAGVGTGYNRWLIEFVGTSFARNMFSNTSLTEDYDIALRLALAESKLLYLYKPFGLDVATRAYFPETFKTAVRQRARWLIGIGLQAWKNYGWRGNLRMRMTLYRDRKAVISNILNGLSYIVLLYVLSYEIARRLLTQYGRLVPIINEGTLLWWISVTVTLFMLWRFLHRYLTVSRVYGRLSGLLGIIRFPVGNLINFVATFRGITKFTISARRKKPVVWDKTSHKFPDQPPPAAETVPAPEQNVETLS
jgi:bacteriophage N4 adsorption protein B